MSTIPHSLRWRLPLSISALIAVVLAAFLWAAYREVEATLVRAGGDRAQNAANQLANLLERSAQQALDELHRGAGHPDLQRYLLDQTDANREAARRLFSARPGAAARRVAVWDQAGSRVLDVALPGTNQASRMPADISALPGHTGLGEFRAADDTIFSDAVAAIVTPPPSRRLGSLVVRATVSVNPPGILSKLVGGEAAILLGNVAGGAWTDLTHVVPAPPVDVSRSGVREYSSTDGQARVGAVSHIRTTPWAVWVEFQRAHIIAPARTFLTRMLLTGL
ncbi:MAG: hypothetical protein ACREUZ_12735, partial [Burkholderiales bacterium]